MDKPYARLLEEISKREIKHKAIRKELGITKLYAVGQTSRQEKRKLFTGAGNSYTAKVFSRCSNRGTV